MAQKTQVFFIDDIDGSDAEGTVLFGLDGAQYEIDLSANHAKELRTALAPYVEVGRRVTGPARQAGQSRRKVSGNSVNTSEVRAWARERGIAIKERGRVPAEVIAQYQGAVSG